MWLLEMPIFLEATGGKEKREKKSNDFAAEGIKIQRDQDTQFHSIIYWVPDAVLGAEDSEVSEVMSPSLVALTGTAQRDTQ